MAKPQDEESRNEPGALIAFFRLLKSWNQTKLARRAGMHKSRISRYESGEEIPTPATLERITRAADIRPPLVAPINSFIRLLRNALASDSLVEPPPRGEASPEEAQQGVLAIVERSISLARLEWKILWSVRTEKKKPEPPTAADLARVEALLVRLRGLDHRQRRLVIQASDAYRDWLVCVRLCDESERVAAHSASEALEWAELARLIARSVSGTNAWLSRLQGYAEGFFANVLRVGNEVHSAEDSFFRTWRLWRTGADEGGLLDEGRLLDLQASLRCAQRRFSEALRLHDQALEVTHPDQIGVVLLNKSVTLEEKGDHEASIEILEQIIRSVDPERRPRLHFGARFNLAGNLIRLGRAEEAVPIVEEVRKLAERLGNDLDLVRTRWLEGNVAAGLGQRDDAMAALEQVRRGFESRKLPYDYALASLDLALVYREEGRLADVQALAVEMLEIFKSAGVHREAIAAVILFREAAAKGDVTLDLVHRLQEYLKKAQANPTLRFVGLSAG